MNTQLNNPLHGLTLKAILIRLYEHYDWEGLAQQVNINCFKYEPSIRSSLYFLRRTPWAREQIEQLYVQTFCA